MYGDEIRENTETDYSQTGDYGDENSEETVNGIPVTDYILFIENNNDRYLEVFKNNENKKWFLHMNWAAFFFTVYWMFYRKMFLEGLIFLLLNFVFSAIVMVSLLFCFSGELKEIQNMSKQNTGEILTESQLETTYELQTRTNVVLKKLILWAGFSGVAVAFAMGLLADWIYREHVLRKIRYAQGGTSKWAVVAALPLVWICNKIFGVLSSLILIQLLKI